MKTTLQNMRGSVFVKMRDYQGNIRAVVKSDGTVVQTTDYYPYGVPMQTSTGAEVNRYKYGGKEFETEGGLNQYDFEARTLIPQLGLFTTPDPKAGEYPWLNPYLYCAANPIRYIDPTGKDVWNIDQYGNIVSYIQTKEFDKFIIVNDDGTAKTYTDENGNEQELSITFEYGTVSNVFNNHSYSFKNENYPFTSFVINGDDNAKALFEFMADSGVTTDVEWTRTKVGAKEQEVNFVGTSNEPGYTIDGARLFLEGYNILYHVHNHPKNTGPAENDVKIRNAIKKKYPNAVDQLYRNKQYEDIPAKYIH